jgi:lipopolysaccharide/colanic/teichoic acid biosynthesis glycosyltransferase/GGDEF domain-containing protein
MFVQTVSRYFRSLQTGGSVLRLSGVMETEEFKRVLERERGRADRNHHGFALVIFDAPSDNREQKDALYALGRVLKRRIRATDIVGWLGADRLAVLLPETYEEGGLRFVDHIRSEFARLSRPVPSHKIRTYPTRREFGGSPSEDKKNVSESQTASKESVEPVATAASVPMAQVAMEVQDGRVGDDELAGLEDPAILEAVQEIRSLCVPQLPWWKRAIDVAGAAIGLLLTAPVLVPAAIFIKIVSPGPIFFKQERIGYLGKRFTMWKLRSMHVNNDAAKHREYIKQLIHGNSEDKPMEKQEDNPSIIPLGKVIRATCVDELPQLINVLLGHMSLVGPRPPIPYEAAEYLRWHTDRFNTVPGMTGLWQVSGKNKLTFKEMVRLDIRYARQMSFWQDARILLKTLPVVVSLAKEKIWPGMTPEAIKEETANAKAEAA